MFVDSLMHTLATNGWIGVKISIWGNSFVKDCWPFAGSIVVLDPNTPVHWSRTFHNCHQTHTTKPLCALGPGTPFSRQRLVGVYGVAGY